MTSSNELEAPVLPATTGRGRAQWRKAVVPQAPASNATTVSTSQPGSSNTTTLAARKIKPLMVIIAV